MVNSAYLKADDRKLKITFLFSTSVSFCDTIFQDPDFKDLK